MKTTTKRFLASIMAITLTAALGVASVYAVNFTGTLNTAIGSADDYWNFVDSKITGGAVNLTSTLVPGGAIDVQNYAWVPDAAAVALDGDLATGFLSISSDVTVTFNAPIKVTDILFPLVDPWGEHRWVNSKSIWVTDITGAVTELAASGDLTSATIVDIGDSGLFPGGNYYGTLYASLTSDFPKITAITIKNGVDVLNLAELTVIGYPAAANISGTASYTQAGFGYMPVENAIDDNLTNHTYCIGNTPGLAGHSYFKFDFIVPRLIDDVRLLAINFDGSAKTNLEGITVRGSNNPNDTVSQMTVLGTVSTPQANGVNWWLSGNLASSTALNTKYRYIAISFDLYKEYLITELTVYSNDVINNVALGKPIVDATWNGAPGGALSGITDGDVWSTVYFWHATAVRFVVDLLNPVPVEQVAFLADTINIGGAHTGGRNSNTEIRGGNIPGQAHSAMTLLGTIPSQGLGVGETYSVSGGGQLYRYISFEKPGECELTVSEVRVYSTTPTDYGVWSYNSGTRALSVPVKNFSAAAQDYLLVYSVVDGSNNLLAVSTTPATVPANTTTAQNISAVVCSGGLPGGAARVKAILIKSVEDARMVVDLFEANL